MHDFLSIVHKSPLRKIRYHSPKHAITLQRRKPCIIIIIYNILEIYCPTGRFQIPTMANEDEHECCIPKQWNKLGGRIYRFILPTGKYKSIEHLEMIFVSTKPCCPFTVEWASLLRRSCAALQFRYRSDAGCVSTEPTDTFACTERKQSYRVCTSVVFHRNLPKQYFSLNGTGNL